MSREHLVLAIDPATRGFGYAVLEGPMTLVDWGVKTARAEKNARCLAKVKGLIEHYRPDVLVVEDCADSRRCARVRQLIRDVTRLARRRRLAIRCFSRSTVRQVFAATGATTKDQIARSVARYFSELQPHLPPPRRPWMAEDYRMSIFDATALAITFFHFMARRRRTR